MWENMKYVFFDLDGTLIDIKTAQNQAAESLFVKYNFDKKTNISEFKRKWDELTQYHYSFYTKKLISYSEQRKRRIDDLFKSFEVLQDKDGISIYNEYLKFFERGWCIFDDVLQTLKSLKEKGYTLGIISNGDLSQQIQKCKNTGIYEFFTYIHASSEFSVSKPNPQLFSTIFAKHNIKHNEIVFIGDSYDKDILPCQSLNIKAFLIDRKEKYKDLHYNYKISSLVSVLKYL